MSVCHLKKLRAKDPVQFELRHSQWYIGAVDSGNVEALQWLFDVGCPYDGGTAAEQDLVGKAVDNGDIDILDCLWRSDYPWREKVHDLCYRAVMHKQTRTLAWLGRNGCPWQPMAQELCFAAIRQGSVATLAFMKSDGASFDPDLTACAFHHNKLEMLSWLINQGVPWQPKDSTWSNAQTTEPCFD
jgi:hypothetical protein